MSRGTAVVKRSYSKGYFRHFDTTQYQSSYLAKASKITARIIDLQAFIEGAEMTPNKSRL
ncbi:MAG: hypothetical protein C4293_03485 [Nitrospiraceae bacterium]